jgi:hypothetical protein
MMDNGQLMLLLLLLHRFYHWSLSLMPITLLA